MQPPVKPSWGQVIHSVLAALFGVQSERARQRDFAQSSPGPYIVVGIVMVALFVLSLMLVVRWVLTA